jgi:anti-anti-sigma factor
VTLQYEVQQRRGDYVVVALRGELVDDASVEHVKASLEEHYVDDGVRLIRVDLSDVEYITLEGIQMLLGLWKESRHRGKDFRADGAQGQVFERLRIAGVTRLLDPEA